MPVETQTMPFAILKENNVALKENLQRFSVALYRAENIRKELKRGILYDEGVSTVKIQEAQLLIEQLI
jgi:uncharacterized protein (UPF0179 family)